MADKGSKMAARQAALRNKKRRAAPKASPAASAETPAAAAQPVQPAQTQDSQTTAFVPSAATPAAPVARPAVTARPARPLVGRRARAADQGVATYPHLGNELKNIAMLLVVMVAVLIALTFVLR